MRFDDRRGANVVAEAKPGLQQDGDSEDDR